MDTYTSKKKVDAEKMTSTQWKEYRKGLTNYSDATLEDGLDGYVVVYNSCKEGEYWSWSPKDVFEAGYNEVVRDAGRNIRMPKFA